MKASVRVTPLLAATLLLGSCYRTTYVHFQPDGQPPEAAAQEAHSLRKGGWQHFFIWGWVPDERQVDAVEKCGGPDRVHSIETRRTFVEGLVAAVAGYYVNVYSPWNGAIYCTNTPE